MKGGQPTERMWAALKLSAPSEKRSLTFRRAMQRVKAIAANVGAGSLPEAALEFYANEYLLMVQRGEAGPSDGAK